jgi:pimeloyl-ACP methyl ester carboxylesterase
MNIVEQSAVNPLQLLLLPISDRRYFEALRRAPQAAYDSLRPYYADLDALLQADRDFLYQRVNARVWDEPQRLAALSIRMRLPWFLAFSARRLVQRIPSIPAPTLVIWGEQDRILPIGNGVIRAALQPGARFVCVPGAGHLPHQEHPAAVLAALLEQGYKPAA